MIWSVALCIHVPVGMLGNLDELDLEILMSKRVHGSVGFNWWWEAFGNQVVLRDISYKTGHFVFFCFTYQIKHTSLFVI